MRLPADWEGVEGGGYASHLVKLHHIPCGFKSGMYYDPWGSAPFGEADTRSLVYSHECDPDDCST